MKRAVFGILAVCLSLVALALLEGGLRLAGVERAARMPFTEVPGQPDVRALSPDYVARYFPRFVPAVAFTPFAATKPDDTFRVIALGGSSTAGFPYQFYSSFPARLQERLETALPDLKVEVVNLGMTAVNSYTLWDLRATVVAQHPDAVVIYAGHNEFYGALGVASTVNALSEQIALKRLSLRLRRTALGALIDGGFRSLAPDAPEERTLMARMVGDAEVSYGGEAYEAGVRQYTANMTDVLAALREADVPVYLATLTSNLKDQPPLGDDPAALAAFERGTALFARGDTAEARAAFQEAKELDPVRFRAPDTLNVFIREWAEADGVTLVDVAEAFVSASASGIEGQDSFVDHLHPTAVGYDLMAATFYDALRGHPRLRGIVLEETGDTDSDMEDAALVDPVEAEHVQLQLAQLLGGYPFDKTSTPSASAARYRRALEAALDSGRYADSLAAASIAYGVPMPQTLLTALERSLAARDTSAALRYFHSLLPWQPFSEDLMERAVGYALANPGYDDQTLPLARFGANRTDGTFYYNALAVLLIRQGHLDEAQRFLRYVEARAPDDPTMLYNTARLYVQRGDTTAARSYFQRFQRQQPSPTASQ